MAKKKVEPKERIIEAPKQECDCLLCDNGKEVEYKLINCSKRIPLQVNSKSFCCNFKLKK